MKDAARRRLQSVRFTSTTAITRTPFPRISEVALAGALPLGSLTPFRAWPAELPWIRSSSRLSPAEHPTDAIARAEVGYPDPRGPDTFLSRARGQPAGEADRAGCATRTPVTSSPDEPAFARPAAGSPACAGLPSRAASCVPPRRGARSAAPKVPSVVSVSPGGRGYARRTAHGLVDSWEGGRYPQVVPSLWRSRRRLFNPAV